MPKKYLLEFVVFVVGAVVMVLELCGSRILAPYVGVSIVVWTSLIGIILGSLSLGYFIGGRIADKNGTMQTLSGVIFLGAVLVGLILLFRVPVLSFINDTTIDLASKAILSTIILFALPSIALGMVSPIAVRLRTQTLKTVGGTVGNLYALSTIGSIFGTFLAGFVLLAYFSVTHILIGLSLTLLALSLLLSWRRFFERVAIVVVVCGSVVFLDTIVPQENKVYESRYNHIEIVTHGNVKALKLDNKWHSAMYTNSDSLVFEYTKYYRLARVLNPDTRSVLMIGGGAYSVPKDFLGNYKDVTVDVVEIDPFLTELAFAEFGLKKDPRLTIYHEDGRTFLNREAAIKEKKYDAILVDVFSSFSIPFHLATVEAVSKMRTLLNENGVLITNVISSIDGERGRFLQAEKATYASVFPHTSIYPANTNDSSEVQNIMLVASNKPFGVPPQSNWKLNREWKKDIVKLPVLTDDFAPVDQYVRINEM